MPGKETHVCLAVLQTLSFGLPPPAGPFVAAGFQLVDLLLGSSNGNGKEKALQDALDAMKQDIENFITENKLSDIQSHLKSMNDWIAESRESLKKGAGAVEEETLIDKIVKGSDTLLAADNSVEGALNKLVGVPTRGDDAYTFSLSAVDMYMNVLTSFICSIKFRCEMGNMLLALANQKAAGLVADQDQDPKKKRVEERLEDLFSDFDLFLGRLNYWTSNEKIKPLSEWFEKIKKDRLNSISEVKTEGSDSSFITLSYATDYFEEGKKRIYSRQHESVSHYTPGIHQAFPTYTFISHKDDVENYRKQYIESVKAQMEIDLSFVNGAVKAIKDQVAQISVPAPPPAAAPKTEWFDTGWKGAWRWGKDCEVRYGISFLKDSRETEVVWGEWTKCPGDDRKCPKMTLAIDPKGVVASRKIKREIRTGGGDGPKSFAVLLPENISTTFIDIDPSRGDAACPVPILPPELDSWARTYKDRNVPDADAPSWPPGYAVRYRYQYVNQAGTSPYRSIWVLDKNAGAEGDEGYVNGGSQYLARIRVQKHRDATGLKVFRQFKGKDETEIAGGTEVKGHFYIFTDTGL